MPFTLLQQDSFVSDGTARKIPLPGSADYFVTTNITQMALTPTPGVNVRGEWYPTFAANDGLRWKKANGVSTIQIDTYATTTASDGFTYVSTSPVIEAQAAAAVTAISNANPAIVSQVNTYSNGDIIQFYGTTGMLQIAGMNFQISSVSGAGYTLLGLQAGGFLAPATAGFTRRISKLLAVEPQFLFVTGISRAAQAVVTCSVDPTAYYVIGMKVHFSVPYSFGMYEMNQLTGTIVAMSAAAYTMTVDIDSSAFTAFAFPASTASPTAQLFATVAPAGAKTAFNPVTNVQTGYNFQFQPFRTGQFVPYMLLGGGAQSPAGAANDVIEWSAWKKEN